MTGKLPHKQVAGQPWAPLKKNAFINVTMTIMVEKREKNISFPNIHETSAAKEL